MSRCAHSSGPRIRRGSPCGEANPQCTKRDTLGFLVRARGLNRSLLEGIALSIIAIRVEMAEPANSPFFLLSSNGYSSQRGRGRSRRLARESVFRIRAKNRRAKRSQFLRPIERSGGMASCSEPLILLEANLYLSSEIPWTITSLQTSKSPIRYNRAFLKGLSYSSSHCRENWDAKRTARFADKSSKLGLCHDDAT